MGSDAPSESKVEIAHVLVMDVVQYSTLLITEQTRVMAELTRIVKNTPRFQKAEALGKLVRIPTGDGMLLVFFDDPQAPIECAVEIARAMKAHPEIRLRMGIHSGPVHEVVDVNDRSNVAGAGVDMAQRVMDCGDAGHILLSKRVAEDLAPFPRWNPHLHELGECEVKHGRKVALVNFYTEEVGNPEPPNKCSIVTRSSRPLLPLVALAALVLLGALVFLARQRSASPAKGEKSIAVLPFENLSADPENAYFADGIQEEILTRLSKIADLKVISRTSTQRYKSAPANLGDIARQLGVAHSLEGSVQKAADQVRVNVQLINAHNDSHLWAEKYDRKLTDVFAVETDIATRIAQKLEANLTGAEHRAVAAQPTDDPDAHQLYLKGRALWRNRGAADVQSALEFFQQAIARDPHYARAYAGMADCYLVLPYSLRVPSIDYGRYFAQARTAAEKALELDDNIAEAHSSLATLLYYDLALQEAKREYLRAIELDPNYVTAHHWFGYRVLTALGEFDAAIAELRRATELDPLAPVIRANLGHACFYARRYSETLAEARKALEIDTATANQFYAYDVLAMGQAMSGKLDEAIDSVTRSVNLAHNFHSISLMAWVYAVKGDRTHALEVLRQLEQMEQGGTAGWLYGYAFIYTALGEKEKAVDFLERSFERGERESNATIRVDPMLDPLRGDPRFEALADKVLPRR